MSCSNTHRCVKDRCSRKTINHFLLLLSGQFVLLTERWMSAAAVSVCVCVSEHQSWDQMRAASHGTYSAHQSEPVRSLFVCLFVEHVSVMWQVQPKHCGVDWWGWWGWWSRGIGEAEHHRGVLTPTTNKHLGGGGNPHLKDVPLCPPLSPWSWSFWNSSGGQRSEFEVLDNSSMEHTTPIWGHQTFSPPWRLPGPFVTYTKSLAQNVFISYT